MARLTMGDGKHAIEFQKVSKSFGDVDVIKELTLNIDSDQTTAIVGESGSGKSTLLQLSNGLLVPDSGRVSVLGAALDYTNLPQIRRKMGYAVQGAGLFPHLSIFDNVVLVARLEGWGDDQIQQRFRYLLALLDLDEDLSERYPHSLSGGQQQRVSLCRAMMLNPPLMLLDEPFSALDPITRAAIHDEFLKLQSVEARTILLVTHDMEEALKLAQHLVILRQGRIVQAGSVAEVRRQPIDDYVVRLFSATVGSL